MDQATHSLIFSSFHSPMSRHSTAATPPNYHLHSTQHLSTHQYSHPQSTKVTPTPYWDDLHAMIRQYSSLHL